MHEKYLNLFVMILHNYPSKDPNKAWQKMEIVLESRVDAC